MKKNRHRKIEIGSLVLIKVTYHSVEPLRTEGNGLLSPCKPSMRGQPSSIKISWTANTIPMPSMKSSATNPNSIKAFTSSFYSDSSSEMFITNNGTNKAQHAKIPFSSTTHSDLSSKVSFIVGYKTVEEYFLGITNRVEQKKDLQDKPFTGIVIEHFDVPNETRRYVSCNRVIDKNRIYKVLFGEQHCLWFTENKISEIRNTEKRK